MSILYTVGFDQLVNIGAGLTPVQKPAGSILEEIPTSGLIEFAEQATFTKTFEGDYATCLSQRTPRGTILSDSFSNVFKVLSSSVQHLEANRGRLTIVCESISFNVPPDEYDAPPMEFNPSLLKNPRYYGTVSSRILTDDDLRKIRAAVDSQQELDANERGVIANPYDPVTQTTLYNLYNELYSKLSKGEETYYLAGIKIEWTQYFFALQAVDPGGYIQDPTTVLPTQFYVVGGGTAYPSGWSWLRLADYQTYQRTWFRKTLTWIGAPLGQWDPDIY